VTTYLSPIVSAFSIFIFNWLHTFNNHLITTTAKPAKQVKMANFNIFQIFMPVIFGKGKLIDLLIVDRQGYKF